MWRKNDEAKPSSGASEATATVPAPVPITPKVTMQPVHSSSPVIMTPGPAPATPSAKSGASTITSGLRISGDFSGDSDLYIDGEAKGKIRLLHSRVSVGPNGKVQADIEARDIVVEGAVQGNLKASESVRLGPSSRVQGSLVTPRVAIDDGARLRGKVEMTRPGEFKREAGGEPASVSARFDEK
jgi:cytoskeletal protein CcmA (bactofilin family)